MTCDELYKIIRKKYHLVNRPTDGELNNVVKDLLLLYRRNGYVADEDLLRILKNRFSDSSVYAMESVDMTDSINIAMQIIAMVDGSVQG